MIALFCLFLTLFASPFLSNHLGTSRSAAAPQCELPLGSSIRARTNTCGASVSVTTPNRKGSVPWP
jgi:hypothetical protein